MSVVPLIVALLLACSGGEAPPAAPAEVVAPPAAPTEADAETRGALVPSATETQNALEDAGIELKMADFLVARPPITGDPNPDQIAVRTGARISDLLLTIRSGEKQKILDDLAAVREGISALGGGADIDTLLGEAHSRWANDAVTREELLHEMEQVVSASIPELEFNGKARIVPMIQAGSWVEGTHLVALAIQKSGKIEASESLLKQPVVVDYFLKYVREEGAEKAPAAVTEKLEASLRTLKDLASKTEPLTAADVDTVVKTTEDVLSLL